MRQAISVEYKSCIILVMLTKASEGKAKIT